MHIHSLNRTHWWIPIPSISEKTKNMDGQYHGCTISWTISCIMDWCLPKMHQPQNLPVAKFALWVLVQTQLLSSNHSNWGLFDDAKDNTDMKHMHGQRSTTVDQPIYESTSATSLAHSATTFLPVIRYLAWNLTSHSQSSHIKNKTIRWFGW